MQNFLILKADNGHLIAATSVKLIFIYSGCFTKSSFTTMDDICMLNGLLSLIFIEKSTSACEAWFKLNEYVKQTSMPASNPQEIVHLTKRASSSFHISHPIARSTTDRWVHTWLIFITFELGLQSTASHTTYGVCVNYIQ